MLFFKKGCVVNAAEAGEIDYLIQSCNCFSTMGSGVAKLIRFAYPEAYLVDQEDYRSPIERIGSYSSAKVGPLTIINLYCQFDYGYDNLRRFEYGAFKRAMDEITRDFSFTGRNVGLPMIGSGLGKADPAIVETILQEYTDRGNWTIYQL